LPHHTANQIKLAIGGIFLPLFGVSKASQQLLDRGGNALVPRSELLKQNEQLRIQNQELQIRTAQMDGVLRQNEMFSQHFGWEKQSPWRLRLARIIARDPANWWHSISIDVGAREGMRQDMPVVISGGFLVGRISRVNLTSSEVALIGTPECKVAVVDQESHDTGVITGMNPVDNTLVTMSFLSTSANLKPGQRVITSGQGGLFPANIIVGQVAEEANISDLGYSEARVKLGANLGALEEVWVVIK